MRQQLGRSIGATYNNIILNKISPFELFRATPVYRIIGEVFNSSHKAVHMSDIGRLVLLYKYGGIYSDLDGFLIGSLEELGLTYVTRNSDSRNVANAFLASRKNDLHFLEILRRVAEKFKSPEPYFRVLGLHGQAVSKYCSETCKVNSTVFSNNHKTVKCCDLEVLGKFSCANFKSKHIVEARGGCRVFLRGGGGGGCWVEISKIFNYKKQLA